MADRFGEQGISTNKLLPWLYQTNDANGLLATSCQILDQEVLDWDGISDTIASISRADRVSLAIMHMQWAEYGIEPPKFANEINQRQALYRLPEFLAKKGRANTVRDMIVLLAGISCEVVHLWNDDRWFRSGLARAGISKAGISYRNARPGGAAGAGFVAGYARAGVSPIGAGAINEHLKMTIQLRLPRNPSSAERSAILWSIRHFARAVDIYKIHVSTGTKYWYIGKSRINSDTKVKPGFWKAGISKAGITTICSSGLAPVVPTTIITPDSPGTWVPWINGSFIYRPTT